MEQEFKEHTLPSGAILRVGLAPFSDAKALYQEVLKELKNFGIHADDEMNVNFFKNIFCTLLSSEEIERKILKCAEKSLYGEAKKKIIPETFEPEENRQDYIDAMMHVGWENVHPFLKPLFAQYSHQLQSIKEGLSSMSKKTT